MVSPEDMRYAVLHTASEGRKKGNGERTGRREQNHEELDTQYVNRVQGEEQRFEEQIELLLM